MKDSKIAFCEHGDLRDYCLVCHPENIETETNLQLVAAVLGRTLDKLLEMEHLRDRLAARYKALRTGK